MILVYTHKITSRTNYIFRHIFNNILQTEFKFTTKIEEFIAYNGAKFSYAPQALANEFHITPHPILFQQGVRNQEIKFGFWEDLPIFFQTPDSEIPFDIFAAVFFLISRYEEYLPHKTDEHGRYHNQNSILNLQGILNQPIVELWIEKFKLSILEKFPDTSFNNRKFVFEPVINVSMARLFKNKSFLRHFSGSFREFFTLKWRLFSLRQKTYWGKTRDPYDTFHKIIQLKKQYNHPLTFFHLLHKYSQFDHNVSPDNSTYQNQIKYLADYAGTGILTSYYSMKDEIQIKNEVDFLEQIIHKPIKKVKAHFNRIKIPDTYRFFIEAGLTQDYSMGYNHKIGFRAGTSIPFYFYDIKNESLTDLKVFPTTISDIMLRYQYYLPPEKALKIMIEQGEIIKKVGGNFHPVFHNFILSDLRHWKNWNKLYIETVKHFATDDH